MDINIAKDGVIRLEFKDGKSSKFWQLEKTRDGNWVAQYGRIGSSGQSIGYDSRTAQIKLNEKLAKGYKIVTGRKMDVESMLKSDLEKDGLIKVDFMKELEKV